MYYLITCFNIKIFPFHSGWWVHIHQNKPVAALSSPIFNNRYWLLLLLPQLEEEQNLVSELRKIEARKKERDKKAQDLQKLITAADNQVDARKLERKVPRKKLQQARPRVDTNVSFLVFIIGFVILVIVP